MAQADYLFRISLDASQAMAAAKKFKERLQKEIGDIKIKDIRIQTTGVRRAAAQTGKVARKEFAREMDTSIQRFQTTAARAQMSLGDPLLNALETSMIVPTKGGVRAVDTLEKRLKSFDQEVGKMGFTAGQWQKSSWLQQRMGVLQAAQRQVWGIRGMGVQAQMYGRGMMMSGAAGLGAAGMAAKEYAQFAEPLGRAARNLELNDTMTKELDASLRQLSGTLSVFSPEEQAAGLYQWAAATGEVVESSSDLDTLLTRTGEVQKLASLGMVSYGTSVAAVTDILSQFQLNVDQTDRVVATLVKVAAVSKAEVTDLAEAFKYAGTYAHQTNTTFSETAGIFQLLSSYGQRGSLAGRGMGRLMEGLIAPSKQAQKAMDELFKTAFGRTDVLVNAEGQFVGMANAVKILAQATEHLTDAERASFVARITTQNAARVLLPLLGSELEARKRGISAIEENIKIIDGQADIHTQTYVKMMKDVYGYTVSVKSATQTMEDQWTQFLESTDGRVKMAQASMQSAIVTIGGSIMTIILPAVEKFAAALRGISSFVETHPGAVQSFLTGAAILVGLGAILHVIGKGLTLYADAKAILMAVTFKTSVNQFGAEVAGFVAGVEMLNLGKVGLGTTPVMTKGGVWTLTGAGAKGGVKAGAAAGAAGAFGGATLLGVIGIGVAIAAAAAAALELGSQLHTGRSFLDMMSHDAEVLAAHMEAAVDAAKILNDPEMAPERKKSRLEEELRIAKAKAQQLKEWERMQREVSWGRQGVLIDPKRAEQYAARLEREVPSEYRHKGKIIPAFLEEGALTAAAAVKEYEDALWDLWVAMGQGDIAQADQILLMRAAAVEREKLAALARYEASKYGPQWRAQTPEYPRFAGPVRESGQLMMDLLERQGLPLLADWTVALGQMRFDKLTELAEVLGLDAAAMDEFLRSMAGVEGQMNQTFGTTIQNAITLLREFGRAMPTEMEMVGQIRTSAQGAWGKAKGLQAIGWSSEDIIGMYDAYLTGLELAATKAEGMTNWAAELYMQAYQTAFDETVQGNIDMHTEMKKNAEQAIKDQQQMYEKAAQGLRGFVEAALTPTQVTAEDVAATQAGDYIDKWDEEARRMKAAMAGSARWKEMIPEGVWSRGSDAAKDWGKNWIKQFYAGMNPDAIRWDPLLDSIENALAMAAGKRNLVEVVLQKLAEERGITATSEQVLAAMGMTGILPTGMFGPGVAGGIATSPEEFMASALDMAENIVGPLGEELGQMDLSDQAQSLLQQLNKGIGEKKDTIKWCDQFKKSVTKDISENKGQLKDAGVLIGNALWDGVYQAFEDANIVWVIAHKVIAIINAEKANSSTANRAGGPQP